MGTQQPCKAGRAGSIPARCSDALFAEPGEHRHCLEARAHPRLEARAHPRALFHSARSGAIPLPAYERLNVGARVQCLCAHRFDRCPGLLTATLNARSISSRHFGQKRHFARRHSGKVLLAAVRTSEFPEVIGTRTPRFPIDQFDGSCAIGANETVSFPNNLHRVPLYRTITNANCGSSSAFVSGRFAP